MSNTPANQTDNERLMHLEEALRARQERAKVLAGVGANPVEVLEVIDLGAHGGGDKILGRIEVGRLILVLPGVGVVKGARMLAEADVDHDLHLDMLNAAERKSLKDSIQAFFDAHPGSTDAKSR